MPELQDSSEDGIVSYKESDLKKKNLTIQTNTATMQCGYTLLIQRWTFARQSERLPEVSQSVKCRDLLVFAFYVIAFHVHDKNLRVFWVWIGRVCSAPSTIAKYLINYSLIASYANGVEWKSPSGRTEGEMSLHCHLGQLANRSLIGHWCERRDMMCVTSDTTSHPYHSVCLIIIYFKIGAR